MMMRRPAHALLLAAPLLFGCAHTGGETFSCEADGFDPIACRVDLDVCVTGDGAPSCYPLDSHWADPETLGWPQLYGVSHDVANDACPGPWTYDDQRATVLCEAPSPRFCPYYDAGIVQGWGLCAEGEVCVTTLSGDCGSQCVAVPAECADSVDCECMADVACATRPELCSDEPECKGGVLECNSYQG